MTLRPTARGRRPHVRLRLVMGYGWWCGAPATASARRGGRPSASRPSGGVASGDVVTGIDMVTCPQPQGRLPNNIIFEDEERVEAKFEDTDTWYTAIVLSRDDENDRYRVMWDDETHQNREQDTPSHHVRKAAKKRRIIRKSYVFEYPIEQWGSSKRKSAAKNT